MVGRLCVIELEVRGSLSVEGLLSLVCTWPEIGLPVTQTDIILPDLAVRAAEAVPLWDAAEDSEA
jgi:hypothetical protein